MMKMQYDKNAIYHMRFPQKLWYLLNLKTDAILWGSTGRTILLNYRVLRNYLQCDHSIFKTTNISSFVRQLNLYGFRKVTSHLQDPLCNSSNPYIHEYVHDYFHYGRPELLNKITRKALAMKRNFKPKVRCCNMDQLLYFTPLQKARHAFQLALRKATQSSFIYNFPKQFSDNKLDYEDAQDDYCEDETVELAWLSAKDDIPEHILPKTELSQEYSNTNTMAEDSHSCGDITQDTLINFNVDSCNQSSDNFTNQFLSMPVLDSEPTGNNSTVELLAEFNIDNDDGEIAGKLNESKMNIHNSLNCVLPSVSNDHNDDITMSEKTIEQSDHYHGEWDQMLNDIMTSKGSNTECGSDLKELYSQISKTIDLLNENEI